MVEWMTMMTLLLLLSIVTSKLMLIRHKPAPPDARIHAPHRLPLHVDFKHCNHFYDGELLLIRCFSFLIHPLCICWCSILLQACMSSFKVPIVEAVLVELDLQRLARDGDEGEVGNFDPKKRTLKLPSLVLHANL